MKKYRRSMVPMSADPFTFGHLDLIRSASKISNEVLVLIADNPKKKNTYLYSLAERAAMATRAVAEAEGLDSAVRVIGSHGLLVDVWLRENCDGLIRGARNPAELDFEEEQAQINALILPKLEGHIEFVEPSEPRLRLVSSTLVKTFVENDLDVDAFVPMFVKQSLEERMLGQYRIAVTGSIAVGKSFVAKQLVKVAAAWGHQAHHVNVDELLRELYAEQTAGAQEVRDSLEKRFGGAVLSDSGRLVDRKRLAELIFRPEAFMDREFIVGLTMPHVHRLFRKATAGARGIVVVEWAQLAEMDMGAWTNHNVVVVDSPDRMKFISERGLDPERTAAMAGLQLPAGEKFARLEIARTAAKSGATFLHYNLRRPDPEAAHADARDLFSRVRARCFPDLGAR